MTELPGDQLTFSVVTNFPWSYVLCHSGSDCETRAPEPRWRVAYQRRGEERIAFLRLWFAGRRGDGATRSDVEDGAATEEMRTGRPDHTEAYPAEIYY